MKILNTDYTEYVDIIGTAHFTRRSIDDAYRSIESLKPKDVALELDWRRFQHLNNACSNCPKNRSCKRICEFTGAAEALGNVNANIWLIDMTEDEIRQRIGNIMTPYENVHLGFQLRRNINEDPVDLWEKGFKDKVVNDYKKQIEASRKSFPSLWRVLIDERNTLMAARLAWITSKNLKEKKHSKVLTFVGAAHVEGISDLLVNPFLIKGELSRLQLSFTEPTLVRRVAVQWN